MDEFNYQEAIAKIKARFPEGTVKKREDTGRAYIPNQVYNDRVELATQSQWTLEYSEVEINVPQRYVKVVARVTIGPHTRDGIGFHELNVDGSGNVKKLSTAVDQAKAEAFREALDTWQIGWQDLAPYYQLEKDWGSNPALQHLLHSSPPEESERFSQASEVIDRQCIYTNCGAQLTRDEWALLGTIPKLDRTRMTYCFEHIPNHYKKKIPSAELETFLKKTNDR
ncbi:hypothetical protein I8J29_22645 [Paenibacillus sp. MWE-103]|uniref:Rad52/22 family double-strand break repair protein n=1 Tax=Paenibacillus artemisiicola TaxID=1172618 RepID=A0ABS3WFB6_9BACL|nr:hypothetical protein [Paenibacillus artemisiicola]MBO7747007.1 hypothetical protein [Paenibacillus artemisiicola]